MKLAAMIGIAFALLAALSAWLFLSIDPPISMAQPISVSRDDVLLEVDPLGWGWSRKELRADLEKRGYSVRRQTAATLGFRHDDLIFSFAYGVTNRSNQPLTLFGGDAIGLGDLPIVTGDENGHVKLSLTTELDAIAELERQPYIGGKVLAPGEHHEAILSIIYPLQDQWMHGIRHEPEAVTFCVGLTTDTKGNPASALGETGLHSYWPMGVPPPIEACQNIRR